MTSMGSGCMRLEFAIQIDCRRGGGLGRGFDEIAEVQIHSSNDMPP